jgi:hypothetical protein
MSLYTRNSIVGVEEVDMKSQTVVLSVWTAFQWTDPRLAWDSNCSSGDCCLKEAVFKGSPKDKLWTPSVYTENWKELPETIEGGWSLKPDGTVWFGEKQFWKLSCSMDFTIMPYDEQLCFARFTVYMEHADILSIRSFDGGSAMASVTGGKTQIGGTVEWELVNDHGKEDQSYLLTLDEFQYPVLDMYYKLHRNPQYYHSAVILPVFFLVGLAYLSFWITRAAVPARVALVAICYLSISNQQGNVQQSLPRTSSSVWLLRLLSYSTKFVFLAGLEYAFANFLSRVDAKIKKVREQIDDEWSADAEFECVKLKQRMRTKLSFADYYLALGSDGRPRLNDHHCDVFMRYAYPVAYIIMVLTMFAQVW